MTSQQWQDAIQRYNKAFLGEYHVGCTWIFKANQFHYHLGYLAGLLEGSFVIPHDIDPELFLDYLVEKEYDPFVMGFDKCVEAYRNDEAENYECA
jgi:hypothetical protein